MAKKFLKVIATAPNGKVVLERELDWNTLKRLGQIDNGIVVEFDAPPEKKVKLTFTVIEGYK